MLRIVSKQAQLLTVDDDAALTQPYRQVGRSIKRTLQDRVRERKRLQWEKRWNNISGDFANGTCRTPGCGQGLAVGPGARRYCPSCNPPRYSPGTASLSR